MPSFEPDSGAEASAENDRPVHEYLVGSTQRLSSLTDGVFSIVMTLMVFSLILPKEQRSETLLQTLLDLWPNFAAYAISFGLVGIYWSANHNMFLFIQRTTHQLIWRTILFLAFVSLLPFTTSLLARFHEHVLATTLYGTNLIAIGLSLLLVWRHVVRSRQCTEVALPPQVIRYAYARIWVGILGYSLATLVSIFQSTLGMAFFLAIPLVFIFPSVQNLLCGILSTILPRHGDDLGARAVAASGRAIERELVGPDRRV